MSKYDKFIDKFVTMIASGVAEDAMREAASGKLDIPRQSIDRLIRLAKERIAIAADYDVRAELGKSITRYDEIYKRAMAQQDQRTALAAEKEKARLMQLTAPAAEEDPENDVREDDGAAAELESVAGHLLPLELAGPEYPIAEHARLAANWIIEHQSTVSIE